VPGGQNGLGEDIPSKYFVNVFADYPRGQEPLQPTAAAHAARLSLDTVQHDAVGINCLPSGLPMFLTTPAPFKVVQTPGLIVMLSESDTSFRQIFTDGRSLPTDPQPSWMGSSIGRWEGDTLVVDTVSIKPDVLLTPQILLKMSGELHFIERFRMVNADELRDEFTLEDPVALTKPFEITFVFKRVKDATRMIDETECDSTTDRNPIVNGRFTSITTR
jgi:hypothetical protein